MFASAVERATKFTFPIIISVRHHSGQCHSGIGALVIINDEGWFVTAYHIIKQIEELKKSQKDCLELLAKRKLVEEDKSINNSVRKGRLNNLAVPSNAVTNFSVLIGNTGFELDKIHALPEIDLAIGQLKNFDKTKVQLYPEFKDCGKPMNIGTSLCKLGYPFSQIVPTFDAVKGFQLPAGALPVPLFPMDGIFTREVFLQIANPKAYPLKYIETSSPGLRGQSGGPTFDIHGNIWAIQSITQHLPLGFGDGDFKNLTAKQLEHLQNQYLNVGWGVHAETLIGFLKEKGVTYTLSAN